MPPSSSNVVTLTLAATSKLRILIESKTSENSPAKLVSDRKRRKTNTSEITEEEWMIAKEKLANLKDALAYIAVQGAAHDKYKPSMEECVPQCYKEKQTGKKADLPKILQLQMEEVQRGMEI